MKTVAFLQNMWFKDPEHWRRRFTRAEADGQREALIRILLFYQCQTGKRIKKAFGEDATYEIVWEETSREIGGYSSSVFKPDKAHMMAVFKKHEPDAVLLFGKVAQGGWSSLQHGQLQAKPLMVITGPHPAARHSTVLKELDDMAAEWSNSVRR